MIEKLRQVFPSLVEENPDKSVDPQQYLWFSTNDNKVIGILEEETNEKDKILLESFLTPYNFHQPPVTSREEQWIKVLFHNDSSIDLSNDQSLHYRFVYFSLSDDMMDPTSFTEAIHGLFPSRVPIIWENSHEGVIIEEYKYSGDELVSYHDIIDVLMSDFYMKVHIYIGPYINNIALAQKYYNWVKQCYHKVIRYDKRAVIHYVQAVPYLILEPLDEQAVSNLIESVFQETLQEEELLQTIQIFLECNSNATLAAKKLFMHRNSLQYRVDKFIEKTGIDVKQFEGALSVYLTLLLKNKY
ncbi:helix-turn-helix domain-containing protein [Aquibacillus koreensis]|uniref:Helix-turn-helix domain-containing protein n=1 Tax=Aquibacillus koreensis TaxID=279446 RepID=A0A9X3WKW5_9BACI|nr:helix-turn-helix domain-containing protein [Aquibacillus koreensis]MCT2535544.1 helix-turn-helix domain-containing protein [Aquibacillus koreensis]MDC3420171.1 helix-turn-helix domain-containing protein [Aquibacillus koreensis]